MKPTPLEAKLEKRMCDALFDQGFRTYKLQFTGKAGAPDRLVVGNGHVMFVEMKRFKMGKKTTLQHVMHKHLSEGGARVHVVQGETGVAQFIDYAKKLKALSVPATGCRIHWGDPFLCLMAGDGFGEDGYNPTSVEIPDG